MTVERCEPPEELRGVDGWHWLMPSDGEPGDETPWEWCDGCWIATHPLPPGWRYLSPVATPAEVEALRAERNRWKIRGDGHAETLRGIAHMDPKTEGERMVQWARDGLTGYVATTEVTVKELMDELTTLRARVGVLEKALQDIIDDAAVPQQLYNKNGPTWTGKDGHEYADMSYVLDKCEELSAIARAALSPEPGA